MLPGIISLTLYGLKYSIEFTGGSVLEYSFATPIEESKLVQIANDNALEYEALQIDQNTVYIRSKPLSNETITQLETDLTNEFGELTVLSSETIGPTVGDETTRKAFLAVFVASVAIVLYITYSFKNIPAPYSSFRFGISAIVAMLHDALVVVGIFSLLGKFLDVEITSLFITAILTIIGFSIHDTIVVFDRIRENLNKLPKSMSFGDVVNYSVVETLNRSLATSLTVVLTLLSLYLLGGETIKYFVLALLFGIISGTYSSIFTASPLLVYWENYISTKSKK